MNKLIINNKELQNNKDIANALNEHFTAIAINLAAKVIPQVNNSFKNYMTGPINNSLFLRPTDTDEILKEINQLKNKTTLDIRVTLLKHAKQELVDLSVALYIRFCISDICFQKQSMIYSAEMSRFTIIIPETKRTFIP